MRDAQHFLSMLNSRRVKQEEKDKLLWKEDKKGLYTIRANVAHLEGDFGRPAPPNMLCNSCVPPNVCFFAW